MKIVSANITGSLTLNNVDITTTVQSSSIWSGSFSTRVTSLESFSSSLDATYATDAQLTSVSQSFSSSISILSGSLQQRIANTETTSSNLTTASGSFSTRVTNNETTGSNLTTASGSFSTRVSNTEATASSLVNASSSFSTRVSTNETNISNLQTASGSFSTRVSSLETASGSFSTRVSTNETNISNLQNASSSFSTRVTSAESSITSIQGVTGSYATTGSNNFVGNQRISSTNNAIGFTSTASLYADGGLRVTKDAYISGTLYLNNLTVYGTQSVQYITASQLNISTNIISVNTDTPSIRYGGLSVYDSGSTGLTGSLLWDSEQNHWIYTNPSGSGYSGGMLISGPRASALGNEQGTTCNALMKGQGGDHITSSGIFDYGTCTSFYGNTNITNTGVGCFSGAVCASSVASAGTVTGTSAAFSSTLSSDGNFTVNTNRFTVSAATGNTSVAGTLNVTGQACASSILSSGTICATGNTCFGGMSVVASCLGIGTATPLRTLHVRGGNGTAQIESTGNNSILYFGDVCSTGIDNRGIGSVGNDLWFMAGGLERVRFTSAGIACFACRVCAPVITAGAGTSSQAIKIIGDDNYIEFDNVGTYIKGGGNLTAAATSTLFLSTSASTRLTIASTGIATFACQVCAPAAVIGGQLSVNAGNGNQLYLNNTGQRYTQITFDNNSSGATKGGLWWDNTTCFFEMYSSFTGGLKFYTNGDASNSRLTITSGGIACFACQVCAPSSIIKGTINEQLVLDFIAGAGSYTHQSFRLCGTNQYRLIGNTNGNFVLRNDIISSDVLTFACAGAVTFACKIGIAGASATYPLTVYNGSNGTTAAFGGTTYGIRIDNDGTFSCGRSTIYGVDASFYGSYQPLAIGASNLFFSISGTDRFNIGTTGIACFACQVCTPTLYVGNASNNAIISYARIHLNTCIQRFYTINHWELANGSANQCIVIDGAATYGCAKVANINATETFFYGPYAYLTPGSYVAKFRMKVDNNSSRANLLYLDTNRGSGVNISANTFCTSRCYQYIVLPFTISSPSDVFEARALNYTSGITCTYLDHVLIEAAENPGQYFSKDNFSLYTGHFNCSRLSIDTNGNTIFNCNGTYCSNYAYNFLGSCNGNILSGPHTMGNVGAGTTCATPLWCSSGALRMEFNWSSGGYVNWINHNNCVPYLLQWSADNYTNKHCFDYVGNACHCGIVMARGFQGAGFSSLSAGAGTGTASFDTITRSGVGLYNVYIIANPNAGGANYNDFYYGTVLIGTGYSGTAVTDYIVWCQTSTQPRSLYGSGGGNLTVSACMYYGGAEYSCVGYAGSYTIRFKISGYNSSYTGAGTTIFMSQVI